MTVVPILHEDSAEPALLLRAHRDDDIPALVEQSTDPETMRWTRVPQPYQRDDAARFVRHVMPGGWATDEEWGFAVEADGAYVGTITLRNERFGRAEIAYAAHPAARGRGLMTRAARRLLTWGFAERSVESVIWWAEAGNWASRRLAWRVGFEVGGIVRGREPHEGRLCDAWVGSLLAGDDLEPRHPWFDVPRLAGERVVLRRHRPEDAGRVHEAASDERTQRWLATLPDPYTLEDAETFLAFRESEMAAGTGVSWMLADPGDDRMLGTISLMHVEDGTAEIGYWAHPDARGRGLMTEAVRLAGGHAFAPTTDGGLGLDRLTIFVAAGNTASLHVADAAGFARTGLERRGIAVRGGRDDKIGFERLTPSE